MVNWLKITIISLVGLVSIAIYFMFMIATGHNEQYDGTPRQIGFIIITLTFGAMLIISGLKTPRNN